MVARVLIVDDDAALAENLADIVGTLGVRAELAPDGRTAIEKSRAEPFDLALVDVRLPDTDGVSLIARLRESSPLAEVVLITGDATLETAIAAVRGDAFAYVLKPFSAPDLIETVRRGLAHVDGLRERERLRGELEQSERRYRELAEAVPAFVLALDGEGRIEMWNRKLEEVTGLARQEMLGRPGAHLLAGQGDVPLAVKAGGHRIVRWQRATVQAPGGSPGTYAIGVDVTTEKEMLKQKMRSERLAAVGTLAAGLAHEIRNPLNSALLQMTVMEHRLARGDTDPARIREVCRLVKEEVGRLERLVSDFLAFAGRRPFEPAAVDATDLCKGVLDLCAPELERSHMTVRREMAESLPAISGNPEQLRQVLLNLVRNALEAMVEGGTLTLTTRPAEGGIEIEVQDTGPGLDENAPVFDAFFTTKPQGTGLGLSIVHRIVVDHGGTVRVSSRPGDTRFTVWLPERAA